MAGIKGRTTGSGAVELYSEVTGAVVLTIAPDGAVTIAEGASLVLATGATIDNEGDLFTALVADDATLEVVDDTIQVKDGGIDEDALAASVAGAGLAGGAGTALSVTVDDATIEIDTDTLRVKDAGISQAKIALASLTGLVAAVVASANVIGGLVLLHRVPVPSGANGDVDVVLTHKSRVINMWAVLKGAGTAGCLLTVKNGATAITDAMDVAAGGDRDVFRCGEIDDAAHEIAAAGTLRVTYASTGGDFPGAEVYVEVLRVA